jgi:sugar phosphate permease
MEGVGGLRGWRWIFIMPGAITVALAIPVYFFIAEFPSKAGWLSKEELAIMRWRLKEDRGEALDEQLTFRESLEVLADWKIWAMASLLIWPTAGSYALAYFTPSILSGFGYNVALSQILVTPPYILASICALASGYYSDRIRKRGPFLIGFSIMVIVGYTMIAFGNNVGCKLAGIFLAVTGNNCAIPTCLTFLSNNVRNSSRKQIAIPIQTTLGGVGGIFGSLVFRDQDYPGYRPGLYASFASMAMCILTTACLCIYFARENRKADKEGKILEGMDGFRYTL